MSFIIRCLVFLFVVSASACGTRHVCSGLNPEIGKYNTPQKIRKGKRSLHSGPEKDANRHRMKTMKKRKPRGGKAGSGGGLFSFHFSRSINIGGGGSVYSSGNVQMQQKH